MFLVVDLEDVDGPSPVLRCCSCAFAAVIMLLAIASLSAELSSSSLESWIWSMVSTVLLSCSSILLLEPLDGLGLDMERLDDLIFEGSEVLDLVALIRLSLSLRSP